jgi:hypothetical protein
MRTLKREINRYRTLEVQLINFPADIRLSMYEYHGHLQGERVNIMKGIDVFTFDTVSFLKSSQNAKITHEFIHAIGYRSKEKSVSTIIFKKRQITK